jgi:hypothetical protein
MRGVHIAILVETALTIGLFSPGAAGSAERCVLAELFTTTF